MSSPLPPDATSKLQPRAEPAVPSISPIAVVSKTVLPTPASMLRDRMPSAPVLVSVHTPPNVSPLSDNDQPVPLAAPAPDPVAFQSALDVLWSRKVTTT